MIPVQVAERPADTEFRPAGATLPAVQVPAATELSDWTQNYFELDGSLAAKVGFGIGGSTFNGRQRVVILEFARSKTVQDADGRDQRFGVAVRLAVKVTNYEANANLTLPYLAVETQIGNVQTSSTLFVTGYVGNQLSTLIPAPDSFNVERYVDLRQKVAEIQRLIASDTANVRPQALSLPEDDDSGIEQEAVIEAAIGSLWMMTYLADGKDIARAKREFPRQDLVAAVNAMDEVNGYGSTRPGMNGQAWARSLLGNLRLEK